MDTTTTTRELSIPLPRLLVGSGEETVTETGCIVVCTQPCEPAGRSPRPVREHILGGGVRVFSRRLGPCPTLEPRLLVLGFFSLLLRRLRLSASQAPPPRAVPCGHSGRLRRLRAPRPSAVVGEDGLVTGRGSAVSNSLSPRPDPTSARPAHRRGLDRHFPARRRSLRRCEAAVVLLAYVLGPAIVRAKVATFGNFVERRGLATSGPPQGKKTTGSGATGKAPARSRGPQARRMLRLCSEYNFLFRPAYTDCMPSRGTVAPRRSNTRLCGADRPCSVRNGKGSRSSRLSFCPGDGQVLHRKELRRPARDTSARDAPRVSHSQHRCPLALVPAVQ